MMSSHKINKITGDCVERNIPFGIGKDTLKVVSYLDYI